MISYAMMVRTKDSMTLSSTTDTDNSKEVRENKRYLKLLARKLCRLPERLTLPIAPFVVHCMTSLGVSYMVMTDGSYPTVLAFSFLDEMAKEFLQIYSTREVDMALRPFAFAAFDISLRKLQQRYNNPRSLMTKVNLSEMSAIMKETPPYRVTLQELDPVQNNHRIFTAVGPSKFTSLSRTCLVLLALQGLCSLTNAARGMSAFAVSSFEDMDASSPKNAMIFLSQTSLQALQMYVLLFPPSGRIAYSSLSFVGICFLSLCAWHIQALWQMALHVVLGASLLFYTVVRRHETKAPKCTV